MEHFGDFWKGKRVLLTGHTGFKGSWLSLWLGLLGAEIVGFSLEPPTKVNLFTEADVSQDVVDIRGDIRDFAHVKRVIDEHQPEVIFHMAAQPLVKYSYKNPVETYSTNVLGTVHLLEAARSSESLRAVVNVTTDKCYENREWFWGYRESDPMGGHDPYSSSKGCSELVTAAYRNSFFVCRDVGLASARAGNVIGGGDWAQDRLVPDLVQSCVEKRAITIRYPQAIRPWQHVLEPLSGYLCLAKSLYEIPKSVSEAWNFGPNDGEERTVAWITGKMIEYWGADVQWNIEQDAKEHEATYLKLDCSKSRARLNWTPIWDVNQALKETVGWYRAFYQSQQNIRDYTLSQIEEYMALAQLKQSSDSKQSMEVVLK